MEDTAQLFTNVCRRLSDWRRSTSTNTGRRLLQQCRRERFLIICNRRKITNEIIIRVFYDLSDMARSGAAARAADAEFRKVRTAGRSVKRSTAVEGRESGKRANRPALLISSRLSYSVTKSRRKIELDRLI